MRGSEERAFQVKDTADKDPDEEMSLMPQWRKKKKISRCRPTTEICNKLFKFLLDC